MADPFANSLNRTAELLPAAQGEGVKQIAALAPAVSKDLASQLLAEMGSQALAKDQPTKAAEMKKLGEGVPSVADSLMKAIAEAKKDKDPTKQAALTKAVATVSGLSEADAKTALAATDDASAQKLKAAIEKTMGAAITQAATEKKDDVYYRYELETNEAAPKPAATAEQTKAIEEIKATLAKIPDAMFSADKKKATVTILEAAPDRAQDVLERVQARDKEGALQAVADAAVDASIRSGGNDQPIVDALATIQGKKPAEVGAKLHADAARKMDAAHPMGAEDSEEEQKKKAEREKDGGGNFLSNMLKEPGGMMMMLIIAVIAMVSGHGEMLGQLFGGGDGKDKDGKGAAQTVRVDEAEGAAFVYNNAKETHVTGRNPLVVGKDGKPHILPNEVELSAADAAKIDAYAASHHIKSAEAITAMRKEDEAKNGKSDPVTMLSHYNEKGELKGQAPQTPAQGQAVPNPPPKEAPEPTAATPARPVLTKEEQAQLVADVTHTDPTNLAAIKAAAEKYKSDKNVIPAANGMQADGTLNPQVMKRMLDQYAQDNHIDMARIKEKLDGEIASRNVAPAPPAIELVATGAKLGR